MLLSWLFIGGHSCDLMEDDRNLFRLYDEIEGRAISCSDVFISVVLGTAVCSGLLLFDYWTPTTVVASSSPQWYFTETQTYIFPLPHYNCTPFSIVTPAIFPQAWIYQNLVCVVCVLCVLDVHIWLFVCVSLRLFVWPLGFGCHSIINRQA